MQDELNFEGVEKQPLRTFTEKAYLDYSMYVILDRALPALSDGLKPGERIVVDGAIRVVADRPLKITDQPAAAADTHAGPQALAQSPPDKTHGEPTGAAE